MIEAVGRSNRQVIIVIKLTKFIDSIRHVRQISVALVIVYVLILIWSLPHLKSALVPDNTIEIWFDKDDPVLKSYHEFHRIFGNDRILFVAYSEKSGILNSKVLGQIEGLRKDLEKISGVARAVSLTNAKDFYRIREAGITRVEFENIFNKNRSFRITDGLRDRILTSPLVLDRYVNSTAQIAMIAVHLDPIDRIGENITKLVDEIEKVSSEAFRPNGFHLLGIDVIAHGLNRLSKQDFSFFTGSGFVLMFLIIGLIYRKVAYVLLTTAVCLLSVAGALTFHGILGFKINVFTVSCPLLITILGIVIVIHIINEHQLLLKNKGAEDSKTIARRALGTMFRPTFYAVFTTIAGFVSLVLSPAQVLKEFGILSSVGILLLFIFSILLSIIFLPLVSDTKSTDASYAFFPKLSIILTKRPIRILALILVIVSVSSIGVNNLQTDLQPMDYLPDAHKVIQDHQFMEDNWGDYTPIDIVVNVKAPFTIDERIVVEKLLDFQDELVSEGIASQALSYINAMERYAEVAHRKDLKAILKQPIGANTFLSRFSASVRETSNRLIDSSGTRMRITLIGKMISNKELEAKLAAIQLVADKHLDKLAELEMVGFPALYIEVMNSAFTSMRTSIIFSVILISIALAIFIRDLRLALLAIIPNLFPLLVIFGIMGYTDMKLDLATATVGAIAIGIAVDNTIYFLYFFKKTALSDEPFNTRLLRVYAQIGKAVILSSTVLLCGFVVMLFASLKTVLFLGTLLFSAILAALFGDLVILPLLLYGRHTIINRLK